MERCYEIEVPQVGVVRARLGRPPTPEVLEALAQIAREVKAMDEDGRLDQLLKKGRNPS